MSDIGAMFRDGVTFIFGRDYVHEAVDLVFHSPLSFTFGNEDSKKGWLDVLIVGDPRTGKGKITEGYMGYYGVTSKAGAESLTYAGLVAAVYGNKDQRFIKWGLLPQCDQRFLLLDELSGMSPKDISSLTQIRDVGDCTIIKVERDSTTARVRLISLSNPRDAGNVRDTP